MNFLNIKKRQQEYCPFYKITSDSIKFIFKFATVIYFSKYFLKKLLQYLYRNTASNDNDNRHSRNNFWQILGELNISKETVKNSKRCYKKPRPKGYYILYNLFTTYFGIWKHCQQTCTEVCKPFIFFPSVNVYLVLNRGKRILRKLWVTEHFLIQLD